MNNKEIDVLEVTRKNADVIKEITGLNVNPDSKSNRKLQRKIDTTERDNFLNWLVEKDSELSVSFEGWQQESDNELKIQSKLARVVKWETTSGLIFDARPAEPSTETKEIKSKAAGCETIYLHSFEEIEEVFKDFVQVGIYTLREAQADELLRGNYVIRFAGVLSETWEMDSYSKEEINITKKYFKRFEKNIENE